MVLANPGYCDPRLQKITDVSAGCNVHFCNASTGLLMVFTWLWSRNGISTQKLHARGPMGLKELTSYKYIIMGDGQIRK